MILILKNRKLYRIDGLKGNTLELQEVVLSYGQTLGDAGDVIDHDAVNSFNEIPFQPVLQELFESLTNCYDESGAYGSALAVGIAMLHQFSSRWNEVNGEGADNA